MTFMNDLEAAGFDAPFTERLGSCERCGMDTNTYYSPTEKKWLCQDCSFQ